VQFAADCRPADIVVLLDDQHVESRLGEKSGIGQAVVARTDDDRVVIRAGHDASARAGIERLRFRYI
jgi:hypothetical protein